MKTFTVAFPLSVSAAAVPEFLREKFGWDVSREKFIVPGSPVFFTPTVQHCVPDLEKIFEEHSALSEEESKALAAHGSLFFLQFAVKSYEEFSSFLKVAETLFAGGALGIYIENSGCAWSPKMFLELISGDVPLEAFLNFVETSDSLFTLGMEPFGAPDLCVLNAKEKFDPRTALVFAADSIVRDGADFSTGKRLKDDAENEFEFHSEAKSPFPKGSSEWNARGYVRLVGRK